MSRDKQATLVRILCEGKSPQRTAQCLQNPRQKWLVSPVIFAELNAIGPRTARVSTVEWLDRNASRSSHAVESTDTVVALVMIRDTKSNLDTSVPILKAVEVDQLVEQLFTLKMGVAVAQERNIQWLERAPIQIPLCLGRLGKKPVDLVNRPALALSTGPTAQVVARRWCTTETPSISTTSYERWGIRSRAILTAPP
jgi:hypothetical protein